MMVLFSLLSALYVHATIMDVDVAGSNCYAFGVNETRMFVQVLEPG